MMSACQLRGAQLLADGIETGGIGRGDAQVERAVAERDAFDGGGRRRAARIGDGRQRGQQGAAAATAAISASRCFDAPARVGGVLLAGHGGAEGVLDAGIERGFDSCAGA